MPYIFTVGKGRQPYNALWGRASELVTALSVPFDPLLFTTFFSFKTSVPYFLLKITTVMFNTFLILRTVLFALLLMFALLSVMLSAWNISSLSVSGQLVSTPSIIMITSNSLLIICITLSIIGYFKPQIPSTRIIVECGWMAIISLSQLGTAEWSVSTALILKTCSAVAMSLTTNSLSLNCNPTGDWSVCASTLVLVPVSWLNTLIVFAYLIGFFFTVMGHQCIYPDIWTRTIYAVDWFVDPRIEVFLHQTMPPFQLIEGPGSGTEGTLDIEKAPWAENVNVRRGKDNPYAASRNQSYRGERSTAPSFSHNHRTTKAASALTDRTLPSSHLSGRGTPAKGGTSLPPRLSHSVTSSDSTWVEGLNQQFKKTLQPVLPQSWDATNSFPPIVDDHDLPIPLPNRSEWLPADEF